MSVDLMWVWWPEAAADWGRLCVCVCVCVKYRENPQCELCISYNLPSVCIDIRYSGHLHAMSHRQTGRNLILFTQVRDTLFHPDSLHMNHL